MIDAVLGKFYKYIILGLMIFIFGYVFYANSLAGKLANAEKVKTKAIADAIKPYQDAIDQAQEEKATIMQTWSAKIIEVEQNAIINTFILLCYRHIHPSVSAFGSTRLFHFSIALLNQDLEISFHQALARLIA